MVVRYLIILAMMVASCAQQGIQSQEELGALDANFFRCEVQPVLAASCAFMACHGNDERPLSLYAEQRFRLGISWDDYETPITEEELAANLRMVEGLVGRTPSDVVLLSEKPLDSRAGGLFHRGKDLFGSDDVFLSRSDVGFRILRDFSAGKTASSDCIPQEEAGQ